MSKTENSVEVIAFYNGKEPANVVTDGSRHKSFETNHVQDHSSLMAAIAYLEGKGYQIVPDAFFIGLNRK